MGARPLGAGSVDRFISSREVSHQRVAGVQVEDDRCRKKETVHLSFPPEGGRAAEAF
jgi:hypothetical protein